MAATPALPPPTPRSSIQFDARGRLVGIDGVLDQISESLAKQAVHLLPLLQADKELQRTIGRAAGEAAARKLEPVLWIIAGTLGVIAYSQWKTSQRIEAARQNPVYDEEPLALPPPKRPKPASKAKKTRKR